MVVAAAVAFLLAAVGLAALVVAFQGRPAPPRPSTNVTNGLLAFSGGGDLYAVSPDGSGLRELTDLAGGNALDVHWSPDGSRLASRVWTGGDYEIFVMSADGSDPINVTGSMGVSEFAWSPDGSTLAFTAHQRGNDLDVFVVNADGTGLRPVVESPLTEHRPAWSPDGTRIAFERWPVHDRDPGTADIYVAELSTGEIVPLVTSPGYDTDVAWSPDGGTLAFASDRDGDPNLYVVHADGFGERRLTDVPNEGAGTAHAWSPDGTRLSFVTGDGEQWDLWVVNADGSGLLKLTPGDRDDGPAVWSPDASFLAFTASDLTGGVDNTGTFDLYTIRPDGTEERRITFGRVAMGWDLSWQPVPGPTPSPLPSPTPEPSPPPEATVGETIEVGQASALLYADGSLWVDVLDDPATASGTLLRIDPDTGEELARIPVDAFPGSESGGRGMAFDGRFLWIVGPLFSEGFDRGVLVRVDTETHETTTFDLPVGVAGSELVFDGQNLWTTGVASPGKDPRVLQIDPGTGRVISETPIDAEWWGSVVVIDSAIWVAEATVRESTVWGPFTLVRLQPGTGEELANVLLEDADGVIGDLPPVAGLGAIWAGTGSELLRIDPGTGQVLDRMAIRVGPDLEFAEDGSAWFLGGDRWNLLRRLNPATGEVDVTLELRTRPISVAVAVVPGAVWVLTYEGTLTRVALT